MIDKALYDEVVDLFVGAGGAYASLDSRFFTYLIECLALGLYYLERDDQGQLVIFAMYWWIDESEQQVALKYGRPSDIVRGGSAWVVDIVNKGGNKALYRLARHMRRAAPEGARGIAWDHRCSNQLRYFPSQRRGAK